MGARVILRRVDSFFFPGWSLSWLTSLVVYVSQPTLVPLTTYWIKSLHSHYTAAAAGEMPPAGRCWYQHLCHFSDTIRVYGIRTGITSLAFKRQKLYAEPTWPSLALTPTLPLVVHLCLLAVIHPDDWEADSCFSPYLRDSIFDTLQTLPWHPISRIMEDACWGRANDVFISAHIPMISKFKRAE